MDTRRKQSLRQWWQRRNRNPRNSNRIKNCHFISTCLTANIELCRSLGADLVIDNRNEDVIASLVAGGTKFDHVVDNIGERPEFFWRVHQYTVPEATFVTVGLDFTVRSFGAVFARMLRPSLYGGGKRNLVNLMCSPKKEELVQMGEWLENGQLKLVIDSTFKLENAAQAFQKITIGYVIGKVIVKLAPNTEVSGVGGDGTR